MTFYLVSTDVFFTSYTLRIFKENWQKNKNDNQCHSFSAGPPDCHDRVGSSADPTLNGHLKYPNNLDQSLNDQLLRKYGNIVLTTTIGRRVWYHLCLLLRVRVGGSIVNLLDFYSYSLIGKLTAFLQLQEFSQRIQPVNSFTFAARLSFNSSKVKLACLSLKQQPCV